MPDAVAIVRIQESGSRSTDLPASRLPRYGGTCDRAGRAGSGTDAESGHPELSGQLPAATVPRVVRYRLGVRRERLEPVFHDVSQPKFGEAMQCLAHLAPNFLKVDWGWGDLANDGWASAKCRETTALDRA